MKINVIALESSGRRWVDSVLRTHPELDVTGTSFPIEGGESRRYPRVELSDALCVVCRDLTVQFKSVERLGCNFSTASKFSTRENLDAVQKVIREFYLNSRPVVWISYETLLAYRDMYLASIFTQLGVDPQKYDYTSVQYQDGNAKYFQ